MDFDSVRLLIFVLALLIFGSACRKDPETGPASPELEVDEEVKFAEAEPAFPREVMGVPLPPEVLSIKEMGGRARVVVGLDIEDVKKFYLARLVDHELIEMRRNFEFRGLRGYMPTIRAIQYRVKQPTHIEIVPVAVVAAPKKKEESLPPPPAKVKGEPVQERLPDGTLLAPGARWGEPYSPPPGSPLDRPAFRANFGKPYGEWIGH